MKIVLVADGDDTKGVKTPSIIGPTIFGLKQVNSIQHFVSSSKSYPSLLYGSFSQKKKKRKKKKKVLGLLFWWGVLNPLEIYLPPSTNHLQFADETLFSCWAEEQIFNVKAIHRCFEAVSGLKVNFLRSEFIGARILMVGFWFI